MLQSPPGHNTASDSGRSAACNHDAGTAVPYDYVDRLFHSLAGKWSLDRQLHSADDTEPSGKCHGEASFLFSQPSPVIDSDGTLQIADAELLYHEKGEFELTRSAHPEGEIPKFPFSRKYIWRLQKAQDVHTISVWFTKPGTNVIDYLFHKIDIPHLAVDAPNTESPGETVLEGTGGHLCVEDFYSSSYTFHLNSSSNSNSNGTAKLASFTTVHEVRGPKKDQLIQTTFSRA